MASLLEMSVEYKESSSFCRVRVRELQSRLSSEEHDFGRELALKRDITMLSAMARECAETSNYLKRYFEGRQRLDWLAGQKTGK